MGLELLVAGAGELHHAVADHARDDAAQRREGEEEGLRVTRPPHQPPPPSALLPQDRHLPPAAAAASADRARSLSLDGFSFLFFLSLHFPQFFLFHFQQYFRAPTLLQTIAILGL